MSVGPATGIAGPVRGDYHGLPTRRLENDRLWVEVLERAGPRIVRLGRAGSATNVLAETPGVGWATPHGRYELFGGHRLWFAPEDPDRVAVPDGDGLALETLGSGLRLTGPAEPATGLVRQIALELDPATPALTLEHELRNVGEAALTLAPWAITLLPLGGVVLLPQPPGVADHAVRPNRSLVLWPYTSWEDPRLDPRDGVVVVVADPGPRLKVGCFDEAGWIGYLRDGTLLVRHFEPMPGREHPDLGCNVETYCDDRFVELETLGPLVELAPGGSVTLTERWEVLRVDAATEATTDWLRAATSLRQAVAPRTRSTKRPILTSASSSRS